MFKLRVIFVYTNEHAPAVSSAQNVVKIEEITESGVDKYQLTTSNSSVYKWTKADGQLAVLWE